MKFTKLTLLALSFGLFAVSCGDSTNEEGTMEDTTMATPMTSEPASMTVDTMTAAPATTDTAMMMNSGSAMDTMKK